MKLILILLILLGIIGICAGFLMIYMPGKSYRGSVVSLTSEEFLLRDRLRLGVEKLAGEIGERNVFQYENLREAADFLENSLRGMGYQVQRQSYEVAPSFRSTGPHPERRVEGKICDNLEVQITGSQRLDEIVIIGAHYDSVDGSPGANDNATGAIAILELARAFAGKKLTRTLRFVEFVNEEPGHFMSDQMGSVVYARRCRQRREKIVAMLSLETIGYYSNEKGSQHYPSPFHLFYPSSGNFVAFVGDISSRKLVLEVVASFRRHAQFPSEGIATFRNIPGVGWSDHWSFWQERYSALMVTDTAPFRYPYYHMAQDTPDKVQYDRLTGLVISLEKVIAELVRVL